jgi:hypothetical protein
MSKADAPAPAKRGGLRSANLTDQFRMKEVIRVGPSTLECDFSAAAKRRRAVSERRLEDPVGCTRPFRVND